VFKVVLILKCLMTFEMTFFFSMTEIVCALAALSAALLLMM